MSYDAKLTGVKEAEMQKHHPGGEMGVAIAEAHATPSDAPVKKMSYEELEAHAIDLEDTVDSLEGDVARLESKIHQFENTGWNEARAVKLRRLETFYNMFTNAMVGAKNKAPLQVVTQLNDLAKRELSHLPENPWHDIIPSEESPA